MIRGRERGAVAVHAASIGIVLLIVALVVMQAANLVRVRHRVGAAADLAALAASRASASGGDGCREARAIALRNGARIVRCRMDYDVATVTARARSEPWWGSSWAAEQSARAAPESYLDD